jgi:hypothetical protein
VEAHAFTGLAAKVDPMYFIDSILPSQDHNNSVANSFKPTSGFKTPGSASSSHANARSGDYTGNIFAPLSANTLTAASRPASTYRRWASLFIEKIGNPNKKLNQCFFFKSKQKTWKSKQISRKSKLNFIFFFVWISGICQKNKKIIVWISGIFVWIS